ncbi:MAG: acyl-CoA/acyl-ACP dehydrogenase, partial [Gammaproteobacteria bacterium]|nr:acyl-CoA/acyl-ACP dehydrogenase [Gammaproteobacteria bacterium]
MDFSFNEVQMMLTDSVEKFISNDYDFESRQKYAASELGYNAEVWRTFAELGWTAVPFSEADGGFDGGPVEMMVMLQQFGRGLIVEPYLANVILAGGILRRAASEPQKLKLLQPLIAGELQAALAYVEPQSRYDLANVETTAEADGDAWLINGHKGFVLNGGHAGLLIVPARTSGESVSPDGITLFAVGGMADGVSRKSYP